MVRLNITMPDDLAKQLERIQNKSRFIAEALREKFQQHKKQKLDELLIECYQKSPDKDKALDKDWEAGTLSDGWQ